MLETLKTKLIETFVMWTQTIDKQGYIEINMATEFSDILARNIIHICFGEDLSDEIIDIQVCEDGVWHKTKRTLKDSIYVIVG